MKKSKIRRQFDPTYKGDPGIANTKESMCVPDMSLTIKQLLLNHTRGIDSDIQVREGHYFEETEIPRITDLNDIAENREKLQQQAEEVNQKANEEVKAKRAAKAKAKQKEDPTPTPDPEPSPEPTPDPPKEE